MGFFIQKSWFQKTKVVLTTFHVDVTKFLNRRQLYEDRFI